jgi:hypothetical protein
MPRMSKEGKGNGPRRNNALDDVIVMKQLVVYSPLGRSELAPRVSKWGDGDEGQRRENSRTRKETM